MTDTDMALITRLKTKIRVPYESLESNLNRLQRLQVASDALRRISRFVTLSRRLESQMAELDRIKAAPSSTANASNNAVVSPCVLPVEAISESALLCDLH